MSDLVENLRKKAREIASKRETITARLKADSEELAKLDAADAGITALLALEGAAPAKGGAAPERVVTPSAGAPLLGALIKETLVPGRIFDIQELIDTAKRRGVDFGAKDPWKAVNMTLMGISAGKTIERVDGNRWRALPRQ